MIQGMNKVPIDLADTYSHIKKSMKGKGNIIAAAFLKEILMRTKFCKEGIGGDRRGLSKVYYYNYISDMIEWKILKKIDRASFQLFNNKECELRLRTAGRCF